nr:TPA_asm: coat protein [Chrysanthemum ophiovirus_mori]
MSTFILAKSLQALIEIQQTLGNDKLTGEQMNTLKSWKLLHDNGSLVTNNVVTIAKESINPDKLVMLEGEKIVPVADNKNEDQHKNQQSNQDKKNNDNEKNSENRFEDLSDTLLKDKATILAKIKSESYSIDSSKIKEHLENFLKSVTLGDEGYVSGEVVIKYIGERGADVNMLIAAGTKVLDAILYCAMAQSPDNTGMFKLVETSGISERTIAVNMSNAKRAIQAAAVLVYIQGGLPENKGKNSAETPVPQFITKEIYSGETVTMLSIGEQLSCANTKKFPAKVFLQIQLDILPPAVSSRCKLNIAGNRAVRYAKYASPFSTKSELKITEGTPVTQIEDIMKFNSKLKLSKDIVNCLKQVATNVTSQLVMHPLSSERPTIKNFTLKLTHAIIFSLSTSGLIAMSQKIVADNNPAFQKDVNFFGIKDGDSHTWPILSNPDADFSDITAESLKAAYKMN